MARGARVKIKLTSFPHAYTCHLVSAQSIVSDSGYCLEELLAGKRGQTISSERKDNKVTFILAVELA